MTAALLPALDRSSVRLAKLRLRDRLAARRDAGRLDAALACGAAPDSDAALQARARTLVGAPMRGMLADRLERTMSGAGAHGPFPSPHVIANRRAVRGAADELDAIVDLLRGPGAVGAAGVARVIELLGDGTGPLYRRDAEPELVRVASDALAALEHV